MSGGIISSGSGGSVIAPNSQILSYDETISNYTNPSTYPAVSSEYYNPNPSLNTFANVTWSNVVGSQGGNSPIGSYQSTNKTASFYAAGGSPVDITGLTFTHGERTAVGHAGWTLGYWGYTVGTNDGAGFVGMGSMASSGTTTTNLGSINNFIGIHVYVRAYSLGQYYSVASGTYVNTTPTNPISQLTDNDDSTKWISLPQVGNFFTMDMGSSTRSDHIAIKPDTTTTTETEFQIQTSTDNSTWTTKRTILKSKLTDNTYNYIRMNPHEFRYVRVLGSSGNSETMSIYGAKAKVNISDNDVSLTHGHLSIDTTDSELSLNGT